MDILILNNWVNLEFSSVEDKLKFRFYMLYWISYFDELHGTKVAFEKYETIINGIMLTESYNDDHYSISFNNGDDVVRLIFVKHTFSIEEYGKMYGYPTCCTEYFKERCHYIDNDIEFDDVDGPLVGSGFIECGEHISWTKEDLINLINENREVPIKFKMDHSLKEDYYVDIWFYVKYMQQNNIDIPEYVIKYLEAK